MNFNIGYYYLKQKKEKSTSSETYLRKDDLIKFGLLS